MGTGIASKLGMGRKRGGDVLCNKTESKVENESDALAKLEIRLNAANDSNEEFENHLKHLNFKTDTASLFNSDGFLEEATELSRTDPFSKKKKPRSG